MTDAIFPPRISSAGKICRNGTLTNDYMVQFNKFEMADNSTNSGWIFVNATRPKESLRMAWDENGLVASEWQDTYFKIWMNDVDICVAFIIWSV